MATYGKGATRQGDDAAAIGQLFRAVRRVLQGGHTQLWLGLRELRKEKQQGCSE